MDKAQSIFVAAVLEDLFTEKKVTWKECQLRYGTYGCEMLKEGYDAICNSYNLPKR